MDLIRGMADTARFARKSGKRNAILGFALMMIEPLAMPIAALGLRGIVDSAVAGDARAAAR